MDTIEAITASNESAIKYVTTFQEQILEGLRTVASPLKDAGPKVPSWLPTAEPATARDLVEETYSFNTRLLELNKAFAVSLLEVLTPVPAPAKSKK